MHKRCDKQHKRTHKLQNPNIYGKPTPFTSVLPRQPGAEK